MLKGWLLIFLGFFRIGAVQAIETLTIYATSAFSAPWGPGPRVKRAFESQHHCRVRWVTFSGGGAILSRLKLEGRHSRADVVLGLDNSLLKAAQESGLLAPKPLEQRPLTLPGGWQNSYFVPYSYSYLTFIYHQQRVMNPPRSLQELLEGPDHWRVIYADPRTSSLGSQFLQWMMTCQGSAVVTAWQQLARKTVTVTKDWSDAYGLFLRGEADFVLGYNTSLAYHQHQQPQHPYRAAQFAEGHPIQVEAAATVASSRHAALADQFVQFMVTPTVQTLLPTLYWVYPVIELPMPPEFLQLERPSVTLRLSEATALQRRQWIQIWRQAAVKG
jgi:thiamine transport system substrate-binding protein